MDTHQTAAMVRAYPIALLVDLLDRVVDDSVMDALRVGGFGDLSRAQGVVFEMIDPEGSRVIDMAKRARISKQGMGQLIAAVEALGYVERIPDPADGRARIVRLSTRGRDASAAAIAGLEALEERWSRRLGNRRYQDVRRALSELVEATGREHVR